MTVGFLVPPPSWADWSPFGPSWSSITPISASGSLREASMARMGGCSWMLRYGWVQDAAMAARVGRGETTEGLDDNADCRGRSPTGGPCSLLDPKTGSGKYPNRAAGQQLCSRTLSLSLSPRLSQLSLIIIAAHYLLTANRFPLRSHPSIHPSIQPHHFPRRPFLQIRVTLLFPIITTNPLPLPFFLRAPARPYVIVM